jgi:hypothetical protein
VLKFLGYTTDARTAEMAKLTENSFRDVNIAFANELSIVCDKLHINVWELIKLALRILFRTNSGLASFTSLVVRINLASSGAESTINHESTAIQ